MSWSPCSNCRNTNGGRLRFAYLTTFEGEERISHRVKLCSACWDALLTDVIEVAERQDKLGRWLSRDVS